MALLFVLKFVSVTINSSCQQFLSGVNQIVIKKYSMRLLEVKQILSIVLLLLMPISGYCQEGISISEKQTVLENIKKLIGRNYVFADRVLLINNSIDSLNLSGKYDSIEEYDSFAVILTDDLVAITKDLHFKVQYNPEFIKSNRERRASRAEPNQQDVSEPEVKPIDWNLWYAQKENFGFDKVEILGGNIGYIKMNFWQPIDWVKPTIDATMKFISNTDALIIDLTDNQGGYSPTDSYLGSYFFEGESKLWISSYDRSTGETKDVFTFEEVGGKKYLDKPVFILVSEKTFSLAEQFAYCMKHFNKAQIVGQTSSGAAHAIIFPEVNENFSIQLPSSRSIHPVTKVDWEGTGVIPNTTTSLSEALTTAHLSALDIIIEGLEKQKPVGPILERYNKVRSELINQK